MQHVIGLDIGTHSVKAMILDASQRLEIIAVEEERVDEGTPQPPPIPAPEATPAEEENTETPSDEPGDADAPEISEEPGGTPYWVAPLRRLIARMDLSKAESIVALMPDGYAMTVQLPELPFNDRAKVGVILPGQLDDKLPLGIEDITYDFRIITRNENEHEAVVAFARNSDMKAVLDLFAITECDPRVLHVPEWSLEFAVLALLNHDEETYAVLDIGHRNTHLLVMQGKDPIMARTIQRGGEQITKTLATLFQVDIPQAELIKIQRGAIYKPGETQDPGLEAMSKGITRALAPSIRDIRRTFQSLYAKQRVRLDKIYICGGSSNIQNLPRYLQNELTIPVELLPVQNMSFDPTINMTVGEQRRYVMTYGLAMALGFDGNKDKMINLRQNAFAYKGRSSFVRKKLIHYGIAAAILLSLLAVALFMQQRELNAQKDAMRVAVGKETKKIFGSSIYSKSTVTKALASEQEQTKSLAPNMSAYKLMYEIVSRVDKNMTLTLSRIEVDANRNLIQIYGTTNNAQAVDKLVTDLQTGLKCIKDIRKDRLKVQSETKATFELQIHTSACS